MAAKLEQWFQEYKARPEDEVRRCRCEEAWPDILVMPIETQATYADFVTLQACDPAHPDALMQLQKMLRLSPASRPYENTTAVGNAAAVILADYDPAHAAKHAARCRGSISNTNPEVCCLM